MPDDNRSQRRSPWFTYAKQWAYASDARLEIAANFDCAELYSKRVRTFPIFGKVKEVCWHPGGPTGVAGETAQFYFGVADSLTQNTEVEQSVKHANVDLEIGVEAEGQCWIIHMKGNEGAWEPLSDPIWDCYEAVARGLLSAPI